MTTTTSLLSAEQLKQQIRVRLAQGRLPILAGIYKSRQGTGRPCLVCRREIGPTQLEHQVGGGNVVVLVAHDACYALWWEESVLARPQGHGASTASPPSR
jgi:hypothetical protein